MKNVIHDRNTRPGSFDYGLSKDQEERAFRLHAESIIIDMMGVGPGAHNIYAYFDPEDVQQYFEAFQGFEILEMSMFFPYEQAINKGSKVIREWWDQSGMTVNTMDVNHIDQDNKTKKIFACYKRIIEQLPWLRLVLSADDIRAVKRDKCHGLWGYSQAPMGMKKDLSSIDFVYEHGIRSLMLTYNYMNYIGVGCTERVDAGLSNYGLEVVKHCNSLGIIVDVSHCGYQTTLDACRFSNAPVTANHTMSKTVYNHVRGKSDDELKAIADTGGVVGVVVLPGFLSSDERPTIDCMFDHIDYICNVIGWQHVAIGTDWPYPLPDPLHQIAFTKEFMATIGTRPEHGVDVTATLEGYEDGRDFPNITRGLVSRGYDDEQIKGILGENFLRVFENVCG